MVYGLVSIILDQSENPTVLTDLQCYTPCTATTSTSEQVCLNLTSKIAVG